MDERVLQLLDRLDACEDGREWAAAQPDSRTAWAACPDVAHLGWLVRRLLAGDPRRPVRIARDLLARGLAATGTGERPEFAAVLAALDAWLDDGLLVSYERASALAGDAKRAARGALGDRPFTLPSYAAEVLVAACGGEPGSLAHMAEFNSWIELLSVLYGAAGHLDRSPADLFREYVSYEEVARAAGLDGGPSPPPG